MKHIFALSFFLVLTCKSFSLNVSIIESQTGTTGMVMDLVWYDVVLEMGHSPVILPYTTLQDTSFFETTDILIISNALVDLFPNEINNIYLFLKSGKSVYLQSEYLAQFETNKAFEKLITLLGGSFQWEDNVDGDLFGMEVLGPYAVHPNIVPPLSFFWYSVTGTGDCNMMYLLEYSGDYHGFHYIPSDPKWGSIITIPDQDWVQQGTSLDLMENIIIHLISPPIIPVENKIQLSNDTTVGACDTLILEAVAQNASYLWSDHSTSSTLVVTEEGTYNVTISLPCGEITDSVVVSTEYCPCPIYFPNTFSPNYDSVNDLFAPQPACDIFKYDLKVFDRWGSLVFASDEFVKAWDGITNGSAAPAAVYSFMFQYESTDGHHVHHYGNLTLIR